MQRSRPSGLATASLAFLLSTGAVAGTATAADLTLPAGAEQASLAIHAGSLAAPIRFLASDALEGRGPASRGDQLARAYLASELESLGLHPGGPDGSWQQSFDIVGINAAMPAVWSFSVGGKSVQWKRSDDYIAASGVQAASAELKDAELVFVGYGIQAPEYRWDDFKGMDLKGKVLVMLNNDPEDDDNLFAGKRRLYYGRWDYKYESAARQGAAGAIIVHTTPSAGYPWQVVQTSWTGEQFELPAGTEPRLQVAAWSTEEAAKRLVAAAGFDLTQLIADAQRRDFRPIPLKSRTTLTLATKIEKTSTANVLGLLPGSDPKLGSEVVILSAHHDHLGIGEPDKDGDKIYNGAVDNASGCAQILAIAKAFAALPERPKRSILFAFVAAEEQGLLGSKYYAEHPTFPAGKIAANVNFDGGNIWGRTTDITYIGLGKSSLDGVVKDLAAEQGREVLPDQAPDRGFFYRSDQFSFAKIGVPAIYLDAGRKFRGKPEGWGKEIQEKWEEVQYHQPSDEISPDWNYDGMIEDARLGFFASLWIADQDAMPTWTPGDEFEGARKQALAAVAGK
ncbi:MAG TPA: M20/M25/M40 family metallo-hydrolase [Thermoanaerobaculia bacterium]|nr:M20/M25/M40 family metallo-hydrolase [Thermoanaerobaculia bacterium]